MDEEYFVTPRPQAPPVEPVASPVELEKLDLSGLHQPLAVPTWLRGLVVMGKVAFVGGMLVLVALPLLGLVALFRFFDSLPW